MINDKNRFKNRIFKCNEYNCLVNCISWRVFRPERILHNNPPQRGGYENLINRRPERAVVGHFSGFLHCPFRAMSGCELLPTALRWVVMQCPFRTKYIFMSNKLEIT
jgi:hypothetical protein